MRDLGEFESVFKRALRDQFEYKRLEIRKILVISDLEKDGLGDYEQKVRTFLAPEFEQGTFEMECLCKDDWSNWSDLKAILDNEKPDLVVTYRLLRVAHPGILTSLGVYVDSMTQVTDYPILLLPNPRLQGYDSAPETLGTVVVATEHMYADHSLVNYGIRFTPENEQLFLCHIEDQATFDYYMKAIAKVPELSNDVAESKLGEQLMAMPRHYAESVASEIEAHQKQVQLNSLIEFGHLIANYRALIAREAVSLMVFTTKDDTQLAMHSLGYSLAVEFRNMPVLLI